MAAVCGCSPGAGRWARMAERGFDPRSGWIDGGLQERKRVSNRLDGMPGVRRQQASIAAVVNFPDGDSMGTPWVRLAEPGIFVLQLKTRTAQRPPQ